MQLQVPELVQADTASFPLDPDGVAAWLADLNPLDNHNDARELLRGLTHFNRLANDIDRRRASIAHFVASLRAVHDRLKESARAQPLPLAREFERDAALADALLREEAMAFRILLTESEKPLETDARRSMHALLRRAELAVHGYRRIPGDLWRDAHELHGFVESHRLADDFAANQEHTGHYGLSNHYRLLLLLALIQPNRLRARQLPLVLEWLRERTHLVAVSVGRLDASDASRIHGKWLIDLTQGAAPARAESLLISDPAHIRVIDVRPLRLETERRISTMQSTRSSLLGADTLERQTLVRLAQSFSQAPAGSHRRRHNRRIDAEPVDCVFSHKYITARLLYENANEPHSAEDLGSRNVEQVQVPRNESKPGWTVTDRSPGGFRIEHAAASPGTVQVGELVSLHASSLNQDDGSGTTRRDLLLGVVRWVNVTANNTLCAGVETLARAVIPVVINRDDELNSAAENGLIIACRTDDGTVETILVPPFLYQSGERLIVAQSGRRKRVELTRCLQLNGLFNQYQLQAATSD